MVSEVFVWVKSEVVRIALLKQVDLVHFFVHSTFCFLLFNESNLGTL